MYFEAEAAEVPQKWRCGMSHSKRAQDATLTRQHAQEVLHGDLVAAVVHLDGLAVKILRVVLVVEHLYDGRQY